MVFTSFTDGAKACLEFDWNGVGVSVCLHFTKATPTPGEFQSLADDIAISWKAQMLPESSEDLTLNEVIVYDLATATSPSYSSVVGLPASGTALVDSMPNNCAFLVTKNTNTRGRSGRGRVYIPGLQEGQVLGGLLGPTPFAAWSTAWGDFVTDMDAGDWGEFVPQSWSNGVKLATGIKHDITSYTPKNRIASQRRRTVG